MTTPRPTATSHTLLLLDETDVPSNEMIILTPDMLLISIQLHLPVKHWRAYTHKTQPMGHIHP